MVWLPGRPFRALQGATGPLGGAGCLAHSVLRHFRDSAIQTGRRPIRPAILSVTCHHFSERFVVIVVFARSPLLVVLKNGGSSAD